MAKIETTRSIKVGLYIKDRESMKKLVDSHDFFNFCVKYYTQLLLEMRGGDVYLRDPKTGEEKLIKASVYQEALCNRMKEASRRNGYEKDLTPDEVESFRNWCQEYYEETIAFANPKGQVNILQSDGIKVESAGGRPSSLICQTRLLISENPGILNTCGAPADICGLSDGNNKANAESIAEWIFKNQQLCIERCPSEKVRIDAICNEYPKEQQKKQKKKKDREGTAAEFGIDGIKTLPLIQKPAITYISESDAADIRYIAPWYYGAWTIAVQRLKSWNTWNLEARNNYSKVQEQIAEKEKVLEELSPEAKSFIENVLTAYEKKKDAEIRQYAEEGEYTGNYRLLGRELRGLDNVLNILLKEDTYENRVDALNRLQDENKAEIGDINLFRFIAEDAQFQYVKDVKTCLGAVAVLKQTNKLKSKLDHIKDHAALTMCDSDFSPAWTQYEWVTKRGGSGSNTPGYFIDMADNSLSMSLVELGDRSMSVCTDTSFIIGYSNQFRCLSLEDGKYVYRDPGTGKTFDNVKIGGGKLQFDRNMLERNPNWRNKDQIKAYLNISIEISNDVDEIPIGLICMNSDNEALGLFCSGEEKKKIFASKGRILNDTNLSDLVKKRPVRVMAVDLGMRVTHSYSIMKITADEGSGFCYDLRDFLTGNKLNAVHERSGQIRLIGDKPSPLVERERKKLEDAAEDIRYRIDAIRYFRRLANCKQSVRMAEMEKLLDRYSKSRKGWPYDVETYSYEQLMSVSEKFRDQSEDKWAEFIDSTAFSMKMKLSVDFKKWSDEVRKPRIYDDSERCQIIGLAGNSIWNISYLTKVLNIMKKWHTLAEKSNERSGLGKGEVFARELRDKIDNLKELRQKETSDALIMTALGYVWVAGKSKNRLVRITEGNSDRFIPEEEYLKNREKYTLYATGKEKYRAKDGFWIKLHEPCDFIIFEELQNYRTDDEKPSRENSMLMSWAHRSVVEQVKMQGELFGLKTGTVGASYSSRFHAASGCPGVRGNAYKVSDINDSYSELMMYLNQPEDVRRKGSLTHLSRILFDMYGDDAPEKAFNFIVAAEKKGKTSDFAVLLPDKGGEYFIYGKKGSNGDILPCYINADINAAQNLAKRWITRYDNPQKLNVRIVDGSKLPVDDSSVRINRIIGPSCLSIEGNAADKWFSGTLEKSDAKKKKLIGTEIEDAEDDDEELGKCSVFRDLSGTFFDSDRWYSSLWFWITIRDKIYEAISVHPVIMRIRK